MLCRGARASALRMRREGAIVRRCVGGAGDHNPAFLARFPGVNKLNTGNVTEHEKWAIFLFAVEWLK
jgi:hypothetical protein